MALALFAAACGPKGPNASEAAWAIADYVGDPPTLSPVARGSLDVAADPPSSAFLGTVLVALGTEPDASIKMAWHEFGDADDLATLSDYSAPLVVTPPTKMWAVAVKDGKRGPVRSFQYDVPASLAALTPIVSTRLPRTGTPADFAALGAHTRFDVSGGAALTAPDVTLDGEPGEWSMDGRNVVLDGAYDVPARDGPIDIVWAAAAETDAAFFVVIVTRDRPQKLDGLAYGLEIGASNVSLDNFGAGTDFSFRLEASSTTVTLTPKGATTARALAGGANGTAAAFGSVVELRLAKADVPELASVANLAVRPYALDGRTPTTVLDRTEPIFLRSPFAVTRAQVAEGGGTPARRFDFLSSPNFAEDPLATSYLALGVDLIPELEGLNGIRLSALGTVPVSYVEKEVNGYAGLNTSDRGLLTTIGPLASPIAKAQILAHELAHYQNARYSRLKPRWLQEGMSEWTAERVLYRHFPRQAVYQFLRKLRFDRYFDALDGKPDTLYLDTWGPETASVGYEKSLMFLDLLESELGQEPLLAAFRQALNEPLDSKGFQAFLERQTGKNLDALFSFWVFAGDPAPGKSPDDLFRDPDGDGLMTIDELALGTDPLKADTDGDGWLDGEEYFAGTDPLRPAAARPEAAGPVLTTTQDTGEQILVRLSPATSGVMTVRLARGAEVDAPYTGPIAIRPPARLTAKDATGATTTIDVPLKLGGQTYAVASPTDATALGLAGILPDAPRHVLELPSITFADPTFTADAPLADAADLPPELAPYDLTGVAAVLDANQALDVHMSTREPTQVLGELGDFVLSFEAVKWVDAQPQVKRLRALTLTGGAPYWAIYDGAGSSSIPESGIAITRGAGLDIHLDADLIAPWLTYDADEHLVCISSQVTAAGGARMIDHGGCLLVGGATAGYTTQATQIASKFPGATPSWMSLRIDTSHFSTSTATRLLQLGAASLQAFETALGRPLPDRHWWPLTLTLTSAGNTVGAAHTRAGAYLGLPVATSTTVRDYLVVEQLARLLVADLVENAAGSPAPYWVQEALVQWLTSIALYDFYPTHSVHEFHFARLYDYTCYLRNVGACSGYFDSDVGLDKWSAATLASTGSVKTLAFTLLLDQVVGRPAAAAAFRALANGIPTSDGMLVILKSVAPAQASALDALFQTWVYGTSTPTADVAAILAPLADVDGDMLLLFEEQKLGTSDANQADGNVYLSP